MPAGDWGCARRVRRRRHLPRCRLNRVPGQPGAVPPPSTRPSVDVIEATELRLVEEPPPQLSAGHRAARDRVWDELARTNSALFDGAVVACTNLTRSHPHELHLGWTRVTYRNFALRRVRGGGSVEHPEAGQPLDTTSLSPPRRRTAVSSPNSTGSPSSRSSRPRGVGRVPRRLPRTPRRPIRTDTSE